MSKDNFRNLIFFVSITCLLVLLFVGLMNYKSNSDSQKLLSQSVKSQLTSIALAAREIIDVEEFIGYNSESDMGSVSYKKTLQNLYTLQTSVGAKYIYALKQIDGEFCFVFDTDTEDPTVFIPYELSSVHISAFSGVEAAELQVKDEYGSFNTAAVPIYLNGKVVGIVCADIEDRLLIESINTSKINSAILIAVLIITFAIIIFLFSILLKRIKIMHEKLDIIAHYDKLTNLPNRQFLFEHLEEITSKDNTAPFAILFIDLDNFKQVNDSAGHDAGDDLLRNIGQYLSEFHNNNEVFRPGSGNLNVAARIGGDEFVLVVQNIAKHEEAQAFADKLLDGFKSRNIDRYIEKYQVGLSVGIAIYPYHSQNFHVLIKYADIAMYHSKATGKNRARVYTDDMKPKDEK